MWSSQMIQRLCGKKFWEGWDTNAEQGMGSVDDLTEEAAQ